MISIDTSSMIKRAADREEKRKAISSSESAALALAPVPIQLLGSALAAGGSSSDKGLINELIRAGQKKGIQYRDYPKESTLQRIWRLARGSFRTGEGTAVPPIKFTSAEQAKTPYPGPERGLTWGDVAGKKIIWKPGSAGMLAHEMGHMEEKRVPKALQIAEMLVPPAGLSIGTLGALLSKSRKDAERMGQIGAAMSAGIALPGLYRELAASARGLSALRRAGATRGQMIGQGLTRMAPAFLASAAKASMAPIATIILSKLIARSKEKKEGAK